MNNFPLGFNSLTEQAERPVFENGAAVRGRYVGKDLDAVLRDNPYYVVALYENNENSGIPDDVYYSAKDAIYSRTGDDDLFGLHF